MGPCLSRWPLFIVFGMGRTCLLERKPAGLPKIGSWELLEDFFPIIYSIILFSIIKMITEDREFPAIRKTRNPFFNIHFLTVFP